MSYARLRITYDPLAEPTALKTIQDIMECPFVLTRIIYGYAYAPRVCPVSTNTFTYSFAMYPSYQPAGFVDLHRASQQTIQLTVSRDFQPWS